MVSPNSGGCDTGDAKATAGYHLPAKYVIHTVGPMGINKDALTSCYKTCLKIMEELKLTSIAFPCISTGECLDGTERLLNVFVWTERTTTLKTVSQENNRLYNVNP